MDVCKLPMGAGNWTWVRGRDRNSQLSHPFRHHFSFWAKVFHWAWISQMQLDWPVRSLESSGLYLPSVGMSGMHDSAQIFTCLLGFELGSPWLCSQYFTDWAIFPANFILLNYWLRQSKSLVSKKPPATPEASRTLNTWGTFCMLTSGALGCYFTFLTVPNIHLTPSAKLSSPHRAIPCEVLPLPSACRKDYPDGICSSLEGGCWMRQLWTAALYEGHRSSKRLGVQKKGPWQTGQGLLVPLFPGTCMIL